MKAFAHTGRQVCIHKYPGRCPGLGASALSGRIGYFNRTNRNILDIERYEREKDGFVTVFPFHSFLFGIIYVKIRFLVQIEKTPQRVFKTFF